MKNISYFCIMKRFERIIRYTILAVLLVISAANTQANSKSKAASRNLGDDIEISLLTCGPRQNIYSLYGHTAIRFRNIANGTDLAINYGVFSFDKPFFILRFVFGLTDYEMGIEDFQYFRSEYESTGCGVRQQVLNLTADEKVKIAHALSQNYEPDNRVYRYNYFYDNCTTRARDIILSGTKGTIRYATDTASSYPSYREMTHAYNENHRWARFGNDLLLGIKADLPTTFSQQQFLPERLCNDFEHAKIVGADGKSRTLVKESYWVLEPSASQAIDDNMPSPTLCFSIYALTVLCAACAEWKKRRPLWWMEVVTMLPTGICGIILFAMLFSQHPTVSLNLQILLLNPFCAVFVWHAIKKERKGEISRWNYAWTALIIMFLIGGLVQSYAEGITIVALSLLLRNILILSICRKAAKTNAINRQK